MDRFVVDGATIEADPRGISYDGWKASAGTNASGGTYRRGASRTFGVGCGLFSGRTQIGPITARGPTRGTATVRALDTSNNSVAAEATADLHASKVGWQHVVPVTVSQASKTYTTEVVFDGCVGPVLGPHA